MNKINWRELLYKNEGDLLKICLQLNLEKITSPLDLPPELLLYRDRSVEVFYAPFGLIPPKMASIIIVGLTPGFQQVYKAYENYQKASGDLEIFGKLIIQDVVFAGNTRKCLISYLDAIGIADALQIDSSASLFGQRRDLLMPCSLLRFPIFVGAKRKNYGGTDSIHRQGIVQAMVQELFIPLLKQQNPEALIVPMGKYPALVLQEMAIHDLTLESRVLFGFPHTSGSNAHRSRQFAARKQGFIDKVKAWTQARSRHLESTS